MGRDEHLGFACWRLGLLQLVITAIVKIKNEINDVYFISSFNRILGYAYNLLGDMKKAIKYHEKSAEIATQYLDKIILKKSGNRWHEEIRDMQLAYGINIGVVKLDLWELQEAMIDKAARKNRC
jgi:tetratricopeptide (TPR) repeat protein